MKIVLTVVATLVVVVLVGLVAAFSGVVGVAATGSRGGVINWLLATTRDHSVERSAGRLEVPSDLKDAARLHVGAQHYKEMCVGCHGAPGVGQSEIAQGLDPRPPRLWANPEPPAETFWIVKNGIRMTGMPAFGRTHNDETLWDISGFVSSLSGMSDEEYQREVSQPAAEGSEPAEQHEGEEEPAKP